MQNERKRQELNNIKWEKREKKVGKRDLNTHNIVL